MQDHVVRERLLPVYGTWQSIQFKYFQYFADAITIFASSHILLAHFVYPLEKELLERNY